MTKQIAVEGLSVGYRNQPLVEEICFSVEPGEIVTLIGPNGCGKSTLLKTITGQLQALEGEILVEEIPTAKMSLKELATKLSMVMTDRVKPEYMSCFEVAATGRYPYTGMLGMLTPEDEAIVVNALETVGALDLKDTPFLEISDGQRQRILLARALSQEAKILILDEPTSFLDMYYKLDILKSIRRLAKQNRLAVIMSLHELDLARAMSDRIICVERGRIRHMGTVEEIYRDGIIQKLYHIPEEAFDEATGHMRLV